MGGYGKTPIHDWRTEAAAVVVVALIFLAVLIATTR